LNIKTAGYRGWVFVRLRLSGCKPTFLAVFIVLFTSSKEVLRITNSLTCVTNEKPTNKFRAIYGTQSLITLLNEITVTGKSRFFPDEQFVRQWLNTLKITLLRRMYRFYPNQLHNWTVSWITDSCCQIRDRKSGFCIIITRLPTQQFRRSESLLKTAY
jgi:hypothetical protein